MIVELRRYALYPGTRDALVEIFERNFVEGQRAEGIDVLGRYRDVDDPDLFVWVRSFPDNTARLASLAAFYGGPVWRAHRDAANATMVDSSNVLQLRPLRDGDIDRDGPLIATVYYLRRPFDDAANAAFEKAIVPQIEAAGGELLAAFVSDASGNPFPALPVREDVQALVWFAGYPSIDVALPDPAALGDALLGLPEVHRLRRP
jgi:hypothetical protein